MPFYSFPPLLRVATIGIALGALGFAGGCSGSDAAALPPSNANANGAAPSASASTDPPPTHDLDAGKTDVHDATTSDASGDTGAPCSDLVDVGTSTSIDQVADDAPTLAGGTPVDGTYVLTQATLYTGPGGATGPSGKTMQMTLRISGNRADTIFDGVARSAQMTVNGATLHAAESCPETTTTDSPFAATGTSLTIELPPSSKGTLTYLFTRLGP